MSSQKIAREDLIKIDEYIFEIPREYRDDMKVPAWVFSSEQMLNDILDDRSLWQLANVATLPGIVRRAFAMPDIHQGYGFPIGGVAAMDIEQGGVISPGGIGYDINCGVRLLVASMTKKDLEPYIEELATALFDAVPSGVGRGGKIKLKDDELNKVLKNGAPHMVELGYGTENDLEYCEERGSMAGAEPDLVSQKAKDRGRDQLGTLGSGNHFLEVQYIDKIYDEKAAEAFGLSDGAVTVMIHCGSRGLGHQTCTDYVRRMMPLLDQYDYKLPDRELVCVPFRSAEGQDYFKAMQAASNFAWANRHVIGHWVREAWRSVVGDSVELTTVYDISHNIGKVEEHELNGNNLHLIMHRKGATRAFGPGRQEVSARYRPIGQPVLIPGTMGTASYVLAGTQESMDVAFGSSCHGAGRRMSRMQAKKTVRGTNLREQLAAKGITIRCDSDPGLAEEAPIAYKDVDDVVQVVETTKLARRVARLRPFAVIKGG